LWEERSQACSLQMKARACRAQPSMWTQFLKSRHIAEYAAFGERLRALGFSEDTGEGAPLCRWVHSGTILDIMPLDEKILGFSNRWYRAAMEAATTQSVLHELLQELA
jgi:hypothetical protein